MIEYYISEEDGTFNSIERIKSNCWINMIAPTEKEINFLSSKLNIPADFITDALDRDERSRVEKDEGTVLIIVDFPVVYYDQHDIPTYKTLPLGIIITDVYFITVCLEKSEMLRGFLDKSIQNFSTFKKLRCTLQFLETISSYYLRYLKQLIKNTDEIEKQLYLSMDNKQLYKLMSIEKSLVYFVTSLKSSKIVLDKLSRQHLLSIDEDETEFLQDIIVEFEQAIDMANVHSNILSGMMDAYASTISNNVGSIMKLLTSVTIFFTFPTMIFSFFGQGKIFIPFSRTIHYSWSLIILASVMFSIITLLSLKKKKLL